LTIAEILLTGRYAIKYQCKLCSVTSFFLSIMYHYRDLLFGFRLWTEVFNVHTVNLSFICSAFPATMHMNYFFQIMRYSRAYVTNKIDGNIEATE